MWGTLTALEADSLRNPAYNYSPCVIIRSMSDKHHDRAVSSQANGVDREQIIKVLSLEYQTLREEILIRTSGRFQFLGLMTTAAALLTTGVLGRSVFSRQAWIAGALALGVFSFGVACFLYLGRVRTAVSARVVAIEKRINALLLVEPGFSTVLSWESDHGRRTLYQRIKLALFPAGLDSGRHDDSAGPAA